MLKESFERVPCGQILKELFKSDTEDILREKMLELVNYTIIEDGYSQGWQLAIIGQWDQTIKLAKVYIQDIRVLFCSFC